MIDKKGAPTRGLVKQIGGTMQIAVTGTGGVGGRLAMAGRDVTFKRRDC